MSLPRIVTYIGEKYVQNHKNQFNSIIEPFNSIIEPLEVEDDNENEKRYIIFLVLDLAKEQIYFQLNKEFNHNSVYQYYYFGTIKGSSAQFYLTRETKHIKYLLTHTFSDLYIKLIKFGMKDSQIVALLKELENKKLLELAPKVREGKLKLDKFSIVKEGKVKEIKIDKNILVDGKKYSADEFIRLFIEDDNTKNKFVLVVPKVILENGKEVILSTHNDYLELVKRAKNLGDDPQTSKKSNKLVCYICKEEKSNVNSEYIKHLGRTSINKIFTITTRNYSQNFINYENKPNNYYICNECYQKLSSGDKRISLEFKSKIAGEDVFIIPEALIEKFDYNRLNILKNDVDLAFKSDDARTWIDTVNMESDIEDIKLYTINFIFYRANINFVKILETIEDVPILRLEKVMNLIDNYKESLGPHINSMSLGTIYGLIPVRSSKDKRSNKDIQIDIGRVLSLYKAVLIGEKINTNTLYLYAAEALEKGLNQLSKSDESEINNYINLGLKKYWNKEDFFIKRIIFGYMVLMKTCQELNILDNKIFIQYEERRLKMDSINTPWEEINSVINNIEEFLDKQGFIDNAKALFYLGILVYRVTIAQYNKEHRTKPILKKIQFQGMNKKDIYRLYGDIIEKLRQYNKMTSFVETIMNRFHYYFGTLNKVWDLSDQANVFFIMAGYSYMVGNITPDMTEEEKNTIKEMSEVNAE